MHIASDQNWPLGLRLGQMHSPECVHGYLEEEKRSWKNE